MNRPTEGALSLDLIENRTHGLRVLLFQLPTINYIQTMQTILELFYNIKIFQHMYLYKHDSSINNIN